MKKKLPIIGPMKCDDGCGDCCGIAPCSEEEFEKIKLYVREHKIVPVAQGIKCPLYIDGKCSVYEVRPMICKVFGHSPPLACSRGYNVDDLSRDDIRRLLWSAGNRPGGKLHHTHDLLGPGSAFQVFASHWFQRAIQ